jgi:hypothetical protein
MPGTSKKNEEAQMPAILIPVLWDEALSFCSAAIGTSSATWSIKSRSSSHALTATLV